MTDILERLCRRAASKSRFDADQELLKAAVDEIRRLRDEVIRQRANEIAELAVNVLDQPLSKKQR
jgi:hypothetical protein